ncbi:MAG: diaminopimelate epimerase [Acidobacteriota bacterium]
MQFVKCQGLGNDFIIIESNQVAEGLESKTAVQLCDRRFGVGADGLLLCEALSGRSASFRMRVFNADGGEAELSGNGLRCLGAYLVHAHRHHGADLRVETLAGVKVLNLVDAAPPEYRFVVSMGSPVLDRERIAFQAEFSLDSLVGVPLRAGGRVWPVTITSMGNPHCSLFVEDLESLNWQEIGREIETMTCFPNRTNVEFIRVRDRRAIDVRFWERGAGMTYASGTGSCAAAVASALNHYTDRDVVVDTLGGRLRVVWRDDDTLSLEGPARVVFQGQADVFEKGP